MEPFRPAPIKAPIAPELLEQLCIRVGTAVNSAGMRFDIGYADGIRPVLATPEAAVPNGPRAG